ncbi:MAG: phosphatidate cytidylyltransferase [Anaerolineales bacterium]
MLTNRILVVIILLPLGLWVINQGGWVFAITVAVLAGLAAWEVGNMFAKKGANPFLWAMPFGASLLVITRYFGGVEAEAWGLSLIILVSMTYHLVDYERGRALAASDFALSLMGMVYCGWMGGYLVALRQLPEGKWWLLLALPIVWLADAGAFSVGRRFGKHALSPRLSPKKTWEGYWGGVLSGVLSGWALAVLWMIGAGPTTLITPWKGAVLGFLLSVITPLGDLGESMIKRQNGVKDSSNLLPGHGGIFDRIDSWLWAGVLSYYLIIWWLGRG